MSWSRLSFDSENGTKVLLQRLAASPLVRRTSPNAAAICQQYFSFRRNPSESIGNFLVRETLVHEEFVEAIIRLHEEKVGISQEARDFGLPAESDGDWGEWHDASWNTGEWDWWNDDGYDGEAADLPGGDSPEHRPPGEGAEGPDGTEPTVAAPGSSPSHRGDGDAPLPREPAEAAPQADQAEVPREAVDEMSVADSFILGVLRGWRLLQAAGLSAEEKRDILSSTKNSLDYEVVAAALQSLWDDQLLGHRNHSGHGTYSLNYVAPTDDSYDAYPITSGWEDEWWPESTYGEHYEDAWDDHTGWWEDEWPGHEGLQATTTTEDLSAEDQDRLREAQQAERVAENLAAEAQRTWTEAQRATQQLRRDRGFGAVASSSKGACFECGGPHLARDCPHRRLGFKGKGKPKGGYQATMDDPSLYYQFKGKGKGKSKKGYWSEAQAAWTKGKQKGKGKGKDPLRTVNAYSNEYFIGGLELRDRFDLNSTSMASSSPSTAMLDSGATASAAPEAVVQSLVTAVLAQDRQARIELDQASRPYFRFGNGKWGRALCRVIIQSRASGHLRSFALYTLPNPAEYYQAQFDKSTLVPILIGMDFIGSEGVGMLIDFATGLAMFTKESSPEIFQLNVNSKGHYTLDLVQYLTRGHKVVDGHAHVLVRDDHQSTTPSMSHQMLELWTVWIDLQVSDQHLHERDLSAARERMWKLYERSQSMSSSAASSALMLSPPDSVNPTTSSSRFPQHVDSLATSSDREGIRSRGGGHLGRLDEGKREAQEPCPLLGQDAHHENGPPRPTGESSSVALLRTTRARGSPEQHAWPMDSLPTLRPTSSVHTPEGITLQHDGRGECSDGDSHAQRPAVHAWEHQADGQDLPPHDGEDHRGGGVAEGSDPAPRHRGLSNPSSNGAGDSSELYVGNGQRRLRPGADSGLRGGERQTAVKLYPKAVSQPTPLFMGKKLMAMAAMMTTATSSLLLGLQLSGRDCLWEISGAPHCWLSLAAEENGLPSFPVNLRNGFDLYHKDTWARLRDLRRERRPLKLWFSLPFTKWCSWTSVNYNNPEGQEKLATARRKERRLLWEANQFIKEAVYEDPTIQIYFEWPWPNHGWKQRPMEDLQEHLADQGTPWLSCRVDGCNYGLKTECGTQFIKRPWLIRTTDERFHRVFRAKVCPGNHGTHADVSKVTAAASFYPWRFVQAIARHWRDQLAPSKHHRLLFQREEIPQRAGGDDLEDADYLGYLPTEHLEGEDEVEEEHDLLTMKEDERLIVEHMAREARLRQDFSMDTCQVIMMELAHRLGCASSRHGRWPQGSPLHVVFGGYSHGRFGGITTSTTRFPEVVKFLNLYLMHYNPRGEWSSMMVTFNGRALPHRDHHNMKNTTNLLHCLGNFEGGGLWIQSMDNEASSLDTRRKLSDGSMALGKVVDANRKFATFRPEVLHATQAWTGYRVAISAYTTRLLFDMDSEAQQRLRALHFPLLSKAPSGAPDLLPAQVEEVEFEGVDPRELRDWEAQVAKFHKAAGHPTNRNLSRIVKDAGHPGWKVEVALRHQCPACLSLKPGGTSSGQVPPASTQTMYAAWEAVGVDSGEWVPPGSRTKVKFLLFMDLATKLRVICPLFTYNFLEMRAESGGDLIRSFSERWLGVFPKPKLLVLDAAKSFVSDAVHEFASSVNILMSYVAEKEAWAHGTVEAGVQDVKMTASAIYLDAIDQDPYVTLHLATSALNSTEYTAGFSSFQWAYGKEYSLTDEDVRTYTAANFKDEFSKLVALREKAEMTARHTRAKRVLSKLGNTTVRQPLRQYQPLDLVKVWRKVWPSTQHHGPRGGLKKSGRPHWIGPGRVVFSEVLPHQEQGDDRRHIVWVLVGSQLFRCSIHSVRPVTETERFQFETSGEERPDEWKSLSDVLPKREYFDLADHAPAEDEVETPDLPRQPDASTMAPPTRRVSRKTRFAPEGTTETTTPTEPGPSSSSSPTTTAVQDEGPSHSSDTAPNPAMVRQSEEDVNDYDDTEIKRPRLDENWVELLKAEATQESKFDLFHTMEATEEFMKIEFDLDAPKSNRQKKMLLHNPTAYLVRKMKDAEVVLSKLSPGERELFRRAKAKEVESFIKNEAVRRCTDDAEVRRAYETRRIVRARWVLTWKLTPSEDLEEAKKDAAENSKSVHTKDGLKKAKARIVILGFEHPSLLDPNFKTASPVQSTLGRNLIYAMAAHHQWQLEGLDLATAFLQTQATEADQELWTTGVQELREALGVGSEEVMRILRNIYGSTTAPRGLWLDLHNTLTKLGAEPVLGERCLWVWKSATERDGPHAKAIGVMGGHVDDFHRIGDDSPEWLSIKESVNKAYKWGTAKVRSYRHAGTDVITVPDELGHDSIEVNQDYYTEAIPDIDIDPDRLRMDGDMNHKEINACRGSLGALQWAATQSQPLVCARCSLLTSELATNPSMEVAREIQALIGELRAQPTKLVFRKFPDAKDWRDIVFISMGDQAHNNRPKGDSTGGLLTLMAGPGCVDGRVCPMSLLAWRTWKLKRKAISSNDAEVQAMLEAEDSNFRTRLLWSELHGAGQGDPGLSLRRDLVQHVEQQVVNIKGIMCTDSKGGFDAIEVNESPLLGLSNTRAALQAYQLRGNLRRAAGDLRWVASDYDLADALTKKRSDCRVGLTRFLQTGVWCIKYDPQFQSAKKNKKAGRTAVGEIDDYLGSDPSSSWLSVMLQTWHR